MHRRSVQTHNDGYRAILVRCWIILSSCRIVTPLLCACLGHGYRLHGLMFRRGATCTGAFTDELCSLLLRSPRRHLAEQNRSCVKHMCALLCPDKICKTRGVPQTPGLPLQQSPRQHAPSSRPSPPSAVAKRIRSLSQPPLQCNWAIGRYVCLRHNIGRFASDAALKVKPWRRCTVPTEIRLKKVQFLFVSLYLCRAL